MKYSFVVPVYHDGYLSLPFCEAIAPVLHRLVGGGRVDEQAEVIFVNDGSRDNSQQLLEQARTRYDFVKVIELSRNFGQHVAVSCGYRFASGEYVFMINGDQQDPPDQIELLLNVIEGGEADIVTGLRAERGESFLNAITSRIFQTILNLLTGARMPLNAASLRVMNRQFVDAYNALGERTPYIPGLENWLGFRHAYVPIRHQFRQQGKSSYNLSKRWRMAVDSIIGFSDLPLRMAAALGFAITCIGMLSIAVLAVQRFSSVNLLPGFTSTISAIVFLGGLNLMFLGLVSLYVGRILHEVQGRPRYVLKSLAGFADSGGERERFDAP